MSKNGTCELCGLPDDSYTIEDGGKVFKVCKLCHDGYVEKQGDPSEAIENTIDEIVSSMAVEPASGGRVETLTPEQLEKLLTPSNEERRKLYASLRKSAKNSEKANGLAADTEALKRELIEENAAIEEEKRAQAIRENVKTAASGLGDTVASDDVDSSVEEAMKKLMGKKTNSEPEKQHDEDERIKRAEEKRAAARERAKLAANPTIDDERISITSPEVELVKDERPKTNFDAATSEHVKSVRFIEAFKYVVHPVVYVIFAGLCVLAVATAFMITLTWKEAVVDFFAGAGAVAIGFLLVWYLKRRLEVDRRTLLLRIRQEQIAFDSIATPCYRELKTKYPIIKALAWLLSKLSVILSVVTVIGGTVAAVILSFLSFWWLFAPVLVGAAVAAVLVYYTFKFGADYVYYKLDVERNQQIIQQSLLDILSKKSK